MGSKNSPAVQKAIQKVFEELMDTDPEDLRKELDEHEPSDLYDILQNFILTDKQETENE